MGMGGSEFLPQSGHGVEHAEPPSEEAAGEAGIGEK
jgi:hypothetical protein